MYILIVKLDLENEIVFLEQCVIVSQCNLKLSFGGLILIVCYVVRLWPPAFQGFLQSDIYDTPK
jgi:hypothetical protein